MPCPFCARLQIVLETGVGFEYQRFKQRKPFYESELPRRHRLQSPTARPARLSTGNDSVAAGL
jgi:hypothetical protein